MSFFPNIPNHVFGSKKRKEKVDPELKRIQKRDNEKIRMPKGTTIQQVQKVRKETDYHATLKLKEVVKVAIANNVEDMYNQYEINRLTSLLIIDKIFNNKIEAKTFVIAFRELIIEDIKRSAIMD